MLKQPDQWMKKVRNSVNHRIRQKIQNLSYQQLDLHWVLRSKLSIQIENQAEWVIYNDIFVDREYDLPIERALSSVQAERPFRVLDIGANVGFFTLKVIDTILSNNQPQLDYQIVSIEGSSRIYRILCKRLESVNAEIANHIRLVHGLVGERSGSGRMAELDFHVMNSVTSDYSGKGKEVAYIDISTLYPDDVEIDLVKCDIEGSELVFLQNYESLLSRTRYAVFELHHDRCDTDRCIEILKGVGFVNHQILRKETTYSLDFFWK